MLTAYERCYRAIDEISRLSQEEARIFQAECDTFNRRIALQIEITRLDLDLFFSVEDIDQYLDPFDQN